MATRRASAEEKEARCKLILGSDGMRGLKPKLGVSPRGVFPKGWKEFPVVGFALSDAFGALSAREGGCEGGGHRAIPGNARMRPSKGRNSPKNSAPRRILQRALRWTPKFIFKRRYALPNHDLDALKTIRDGLARVCGINQLTRNRRRPQQSERGKETGAHQATITTTPLLCP